MILSLILVCTVMGIGNWLSNKTKSQLYFISPPLISGIILFMITIVINRVFTIPLLVPNQLDRLFVSVFIFSIGVLMAFIYQRRHWLHLLYLSIGCGILLFFLQLIIFLVPSHFVLYAGSYMFAWNDEILKLIVPLEDQNTFYFWAMVELFIIFITTPIYLRLLEKRLIKKVPINIQSPPKLLSVKQPISILVILLSIGIVWLNDRINFVLPFLFDFVFLGIIGYIFGRHMKQSWTKETVETINEHIQQIGSIGLYGFIIIQFHHVGILNWNLFDTKIFLFLIVKTFVLAIFIYIGIRWLFVYHSDNERVIVAIAGWTFILNAPVTCMHGMRSVVNKYGPAHNILLIIPPVILWIVNYIHLVTIKLFL
ncbi:hypothetical protein RZN22_11580 [Bacillaceae bacterium S4-13-58]